MRRDRVDVAIIGAGPYGLGLAAHLEHRGVEHRVFGRPMETWRGMPSGMFLKSYGFASNIPLPGMPLDFPTYCRALGTEEVQPIEIATFAEYGVHVQRELVPQLEQVNVREVARDRDRFKVTLDSGEQLSPARVVFAIGLSYFQQVPEVLRGMPRELVSHTADHSDFSPFSGRDVVVLGAGQSALQAAALLAEAGSNVSVIARSAVHWGSHSEPAIPPGMVERIRIPQTVLGPGRDNWVLQHAPMLLHHAPETFRNQFTNSRFGPSGAWWLRDRVEGRVPITTGARIESANYSGGGVRLFFDKGGSTSVVEADHVVAGTGYRVDVANISILERTLASVITTRGGAPQLSRHFESSVPGLYFIGPAAAGSFGPLFRFISGAAYAVPTVARRLDWTSEGGRSVVRRTLRTIRFA